jgi:ATP-dependent Lon protease
MSQKQIIIPMFPLNLVLFPGETKTLHIFEERYKQLINECIENSAHFGIPFMHQKLIGDFGTEVKIVNVIKHYDNGEMDIVIEALHVFKLIEYSKVLPPKLYGAGIIEHEPVITEKPSFALQELVKEYMWISQENLIPIDAFDHTNIYDVARLLDLQAIDKYELLKKQSNLEKENLLKPKIKLFIHLIKTETELKTKFILN